MVKERLIEASIGSLPPNTVIENGDSRYSIIDLTDNGRMVRTTNLKTGEAKPFLTSTVVEVCLTTEEVKNLVNGYVHKALSHYE